MVIAVRSVSVSVMSFSDWRILSFFCDVSGKAGIRSSLAWRHSHWASTSLESAQIWTVYSPVEISIQLNPKGIAACLVVCFVLDFGSGKIATR